MRPAGVETVIFDLDGTLVDSSGDILASIEKAFAQLGFPLETPLNPECIGPPLPEMLARISPVLRPDQVSTAVGRFREIYGASDFSRTRIYPGVEALLSALAGQGTPCMVATNKPRALTLDLLKKKICYTTSRIAVAAEMMAELRSWN